MNEDDYDRHAAGELDTVPLIPRAEEAPPPHEEQH
jgi:hypothetical protein